MFKFNIGDIICLPLSMWIFDEGNFRVVNRYPPGVYKGAGKTVNYYEILYLPNDTVYMQPEDNMRLIVPVSNQTVFKSNLKGKS
jgi:hypothetical protein